MYKPARIIFDSYNEFIGILSNDEHRLRLENLSPKETGNDELYNEARELGHKFQEGLDGIFFSENSSQFFELTKKYGVF